VFRPTDNDLAIQLLHESRSAGAICRSPFLRCVGSDYWRAFCSNQDVARGCLTDNYFFAADFFFAAVFFFVADFFFTAGFFPAAGFFFAAVFFFVAFFFFATGLAAGTATPAGCPTNILNRDVATAPAVAAATAETTGLSSINSVNSRIAASVCLRARLVRLDMAFLPFSILLGSAGGLG